MEVPSSREWPGARRVGRYVLYDVIASGGMASVCLARLHGAVGFSRIVAVKCIHPHIAREPDFVAMFLDEARLASRIRHANVVAPLDVVADGAELFLVLEYVAGESLARLAEACRERDEPVPLDVALRIAGDVLHGLDAAHHARDEQGRALGLVHRDVSPHNVLVGVDGVGRVADFGVAKAAGRLQTTRSGQLKGKLGYAAPEQLRGLPVSPRTDLYSAGVTLWELLAGRSMFSADNEAELVLQAVTGAAPRLTDLRPDLPPALGEALARALQPDPRHRYEDAARFAEALEGVGVPASAREVSRWVERWAGESLASRAALVQRIEQHVGMSPSQPPPLGSTAGATTIASKLAPPPGPAASERQRAVESAEGTPLGLERNSPSAAPRVGGARRHRWVGAAGGLVVVGVVGALVLAEPARGPGESREDSAVLLHAAGGEERDREPPSADAARETPLPEVSGGPPPDSSDRELHEVPPSVPVTPPSGITTAAPPRRSSPPAPGSPASPPATSPAGPKTPSTAPVPTAPAPAPNTTAPAPIPDDLLGRR